MQFVKYLRDGVRSGEITTTVRVWQRPHVRPGGRYRMEGGEIEVDSIVPITFEEITPRLARACGFKDVQDLLKVARHGPGENVYLIRFHFIQSDRGAERQTRMAGRAKTAAAPRHLTETSMRESSTRRRR